MNPGNGANRLMLATQSLTNAESVTCRVDTFVNGAMADFVSLNIHTSTSAASTNTYGTIKCLHGATTTFASATAITRLVGGGVGGFTIPYLPVATTSGQTIKMNIDMRGKQRYLFLELSPKTTCSLTVSAELLRTEQSGTADSQFLMGLVEG